MSRDQRRCAYCVAGDRRSEMYAVSAVSTLMPTRDFYDENGVSHWHEPNVHHRAWQCSNGHNWSEESRTPCPADGCDYNSKPLDPLVNRNIAVIHDTREVTA